MPLYIDMLYEDFAHHRVLEVLDFTGYRLTDDELARIVEARGVAESLRCVVWVCFSIHRGTLTEYTRTS